MPQSRQLAAIMFTDIVGYTSLMEDDEELAFELLRKNRDLQKPIIEKHKGKWLKEIGDGVLVSFSTASDAVFCAKEIQEVCGRVPELKLRIGIHLGEVVFEGKDVFGSGVNIASRLEPLAPIGGILISGSVHKSIHNRRGIEATFIEEKQLRGVKEKIKIYSVKLEANQHSENSMSRTKLKQDSGESRIFLKMLLGVIAIIVIPLLFYFLYTNSKSKGDSIQKSIAILPFDNYSPDREENQYLCDGFMEEIINQLSRIENLHVRSRSSTEQYREYRPETPEIAEKLSVTHLLEGSVQKIDNELKVVIQLIDAANDRHVWQTSFVEPIDNIFQMQTSIASQITEQLEIEISSSELRKLKHETTENVDAYNLYLKGRFFWNRRKEEDLKTSIQYFEEAIALDPNYALAYAGLADAYYIMAVWGWSDKDEGFELGKELAMKAISIDDKIAAAYATLGATAFWYDWDWDYAEKELKKAIDLDPNYATAYLYYAILLDILGRKEEAREQINLALKLNPNSGTIFNISGLIYYNSYEFSNSIKHLDKSAEISDVPWHAYYLRNYLRTDENHLVIQELKTVLNENSKGIEIDSVPKKEEVKGVINLYSDSLLFDIKGHYYHLAALSCLVDNPLKALDYLDKSYENRELYLARIRHSIDFELIEDHPRFVALLEKINP